MSIILEILGFASVVAAAFMWTLSTLRHRRHLAECVDALQRQQRLDRRLMGCVAEMEHVLDGIPAQEQDDLTVPEELVGPAQFLYGIRREAVEHARELSRHAVRLHGSDVYLSKATLARRRCELAHGCHTGV
jgi:hypothetical protein